MDKDFKVAEFAKNFGFPVKSTTSESLDDFRYAYPCGIRTYTGIFPTLQRGVQWSDSGQRSRFRLRAISFSSRS